MPATAESATPPPAEDGPLSSIDRLVSVALYEARKCPYRSLTTGLSAPAYDNGHRRRAARFLLEAASRTIPAGEINDVQRPIRAISDFLTVACPVTPEDIAHDNARLRRIFAALCGLAAIVAGQLETADARCRDGEDYHDFTNWLLGSAMPDEARLYDADVEHYKYTQRMER